MPDAVLIILNANIVTLNPKQPNAQAIAIRDEKIIAVGSNIEIRKHANTETRIVDARGRTIVPGLVDCHAHMTGFGYSLQEVDLRSAKSIAEVQQTAQEYGERNPDRNWILGGRLHTWTTHKIIGYPIMILSLLLIFYSIFTFGGYTSELLSTFFHEWEPLFASLFGTGIVGKLVWGGIIEGVIAGVTIALPYILPFYVILYLLEGSGYLSRIAFLMDNAMHKIGLHGKAFIPVILGYGCNVPACLGCRIMETERERFLAAFVTTLVPCAARTVIILGLVGRFMGVQWALMLYVIDLLIIFILGRLTFKILPGEPTALIMEMHDYRLPHLKTVLKQTWFRLAEFIKIAFPLIIVGSFAIKLAEVLGLLEPIATVLSPVTVMWLGLPMITGITLIFGVLRKELTLIMLASLLGTTNFAQVLTPIQMVVFTLVAMFYIPCIATIAALVREFGWKKALFVTIFEIVFAISLGGIVLRVLTPVT